MKRWTIKELSETTDLKKPTLRRALRKEIGLTEQEIKKYQMEWVLEDHYDGEAEV